MKNLLKYHILFALLLIATTMFAQSETTLDKEVEVVKAFQPTISDAQKIMTNPSISDTTNYSPTFDYRIYSKDIEVEKTINHLPVVKLATPPPNKSNTGFVKGGFGNAITPYGELFVNASPSRNADFGLHLFHYSSQPNILLNNELRAKAPYSNNMAKIFAKNYFRKALLEWDLAYNRERYSYYGFPGTDSLFYQSQEISSATLNERQVFSNASANVNLRNTIARTNFSYQIGLGYDYFWNMTGQTAHNANYKGDYTTRYRTFNVLYNTRFTFTAQSNIENYFDALLTDRQFYEIGLSPQAQYSKGNIELKAGLNTGAIINPDTTMLFHISPKIYFAYHPIRDMLSLFVGTDGGFQPNAYTSAIKQNPFIINNIDMMPTEELIAFYGGIRGKFSRKISFLFDVNYAMKHDEAFWYLSETHTATDTMVHNLFVAEYDNVNTLRFGGNIRYSGEKFTLELKGNYYMHDAENLTTLSHAPVFDASLFSSFQITSQVKATLNSKVVGPREATYRVFGLNGNTKEIYTLPTIIDIGLGLEYEFSNKLSFFINANNLINRKQEIWHGYNAPGLMIMAGARYTF
jgi:hypothetical protein